MLEAGTRIRVQRRNAKRGARGPQVVEGAKRAMTAAAYVLLGIGAVALATIALSARPGAAQTAQDTTPIRIVALGDSLVAGFGLAPGQDFATQLEASLKADGVNAMVINAGVSGDTAAAGLARYDWAVPDNADAIIVELGANDGLRGLPVAGARAALDEILAKSKARDLEILLTGMEAPRGLGEAYFNAFKAMYPALAKKHDALLYPFFLEGVALDRGLNLPDGIHPNAAGVRKIVETIRPKVDALIDRVRAKRTGAAPS